MVYPICRRCARSASPQQIGTQHRAAPVAVGIEILAGACGHPLQAEAVNERAQRSCGVLGFERAELLLVNPFLDHPRVTLHAFVEKCEQELAEALVPEAEGGKIKKNHVQLPVHLGAVKEDFDLGRDSRSRRVGACSDFIQCVLELAEQPLEDCVKQIVLRPEVVERASLARSGALDYRVDCGALNALLQNFSVARANERLAALPGQLGVSPAWTHNLSLVAEASGRIIALRVRIGGTLATHMTAFLIVASLLLLQSLLSLRGGFRFLKFVRRRRSEPLGSYHPPAAVLVPCKGRDCDLEENAAKFLHQDYPGYEVIFIVASRSDPAYAFLSELVKQSSAAPENAARACSLVVAEPPESNGEKVNNLLAGLKALNGRGEVLVFADIDARPGARWLRTLVAPLEDASTTMSTGFRWYLPGAGFVSRLRAAWDSSIATMMGEHAHNFAWGGSMAIRRAEFERLRVADKYWQGTVSDDYAITRAVRDAGGSIRFEPRCLMATESRASFGEFMRWTNRQIIITRVYHARYWVLGVASYSLYGLVFVSGVVLIAASSIIWQRAAAVAFLAAISLLGIAKGSLRTKAAREILPAEAARWKRYGGCYWQLAPLVPWIMLFNFVFAAFARRIEWSGTVYELKSRDRLRIVRRAEL